jgi:Ser/Thr protein kinase RdoA (MazF antagonist)
MKHKNEVMQRMQRFVAGPLRDELGYRQKKFTLEATDLGIHSYVFFLTFEGGPPLVVKAITSKKRFRSLVQCTEHLSQKDVRVPQILYAHEDRRIFPWDRMHVICEEQIVGRTMFEMQPTEVPVPEIARFFFRMHSMKRETWGKIDEAHKDGLHEHFMAKAREKLKQWQQHDPACESSFAGNCVGWMKTQQKIIQDISSFSISHGDPNPGNIMYSTDGEIVLLDVGHLRYFPRALDYYQLLIHFCQDREELIRRFEENYFTGMSQEEKRVFDESHLFFKISVLIDFGETLAVRLTATERKHPWHEEFTVNLGKIRRAIEEIIES